MPTDQLDGPPVVFIVFFVVVALLIVFGIVRTAIGLGRGTSGPGRPTMRDDLGAREHQHWSDQQLHQNGMGGAPPETGMHGGHHHMDHTPPPSPPTS